MNYGIPIVVAVNKSDLIEESLKEKDGEMKLDYILYSLRNFTITCTLYSDIFRWSQSVLFEF